MKYGLPQEVLGGIIECLSANDCIEEAILYASHAKGNYKNGSDIDLALKGDRLTLQDIYRLEDRLDDLLLPYRFDISLYHQIVNPDLLSHINLVEIMLYEAGKTVSPIVKPSLCSSAYICPLYDTN